MEAGVRIVWSVARITLLPVSRHPDPGRGDPAPGITSNGHLGPRQAGQAGLGAAVRSLGAVIARFLSIYQSCDTS